MNDIEESTQLLNRIRNRVQDSVDSLLASDVIRLDTIMSQNGTPPKQWGRRKKMGRPRTGTTVLENVTHGPSAYNKGCRCDVCREANRLRAARYRAKRSAR